MVIRGLLTEFVDIIPVGTIDRKQIDKNKHRMRTKCTLEHKYRVMTSYKHTNTDAIGH